MMTGSDNEAWTLNTEMNKIEFVHNLRNSVQAIDIDSCNPTDLFFLRQSGFFSGHCDQFDRPEAGSKVMSQKVLGFL